jgi:hypothetical protein
MKKCKKCKKELDESCFNKDKKYYDGLAYWCKQCAKEYSKIHYQENKKEYRNNHKKYYQENKKELREHNKKYRDNHKEEIKKYRDNHKSERKKYRKNHKEEISKYEKIYKKKHRKERNERARNRYKTDINYKILRDLRNRVNFLLDGETKSDHTLNLLGIKETTKNSTVEPMEFLKMWFLMTAFHNGITDFDPNDFNCYKKYHKDHIVPCSWFNMKDPNQQRECFNWRNLQILTAEENMKKHDKLIYKG